MRRFRPTVPDRIALEAAIFHGQVICGCGCGAVIRPGEMEREHDPALELRSYDPVTRMYTPHANDPTYIKLWRKSCHDTKTNGPGGERRITTKGSDNHTARRIARLAEKHTRHISAMGGKGKEVKTMAKKPVKKPMKKGAKRGPRKGSKSNDDD